MISDDIDKTCKQSNVNLPWTKREKQNFETWWKATHLSKRKKILYDQAILADEAKSADRVPKREYFSSFFDSKKLI